MALGIWQAFFAVTPLNGLVELSEPAAFSFASFAGTDLQLGGLRSVTPAVAHALARYEWEWFGGSGVNLRPPVKRSIQAVLKRKHTPQ